MVAIEETPLYKEILQTGFVQGREEGIQTTLEQTIAHIITLRFGSFPADLPPRLAARTNDELKALIAVVLNTESLDALRQHLDQMHPQHNA